MRPAVHRRLDRLARLDDAFDALAVREREREPPGRLLPLRAYKQELGEELVVREAAVAVDEPEPPIAGDAGEVELDLFRMHQRERLYRRNRDPRYAALHSPNLARRREAAWSAAAMRRSTQLNDNCSRREARAACAGA